jgi:hypothetical protein
MYVIDTSLNLLTLASTAMERFHAMRNLKQYNQDDQEFTRYTLILIAVLLVILFSVSFRRIWKARRENADLFAEYVERRGLIDEEIRVLVKIIRKEKLRLPASIFTMNDAFNDGCEKLKAELFKKHNREELLRVEPIIASLRSKLGFREPFRFSAGIHFHRYYQQRHLALGKEVVIDAKSAMKKKLSMRQSFETTIKNWPYN